MQQPQQGEPRNLGEEVVVAIVALAVIAFAFAFGVVVSVVNDAPEPATATPIVTLATLPPTATIDFTPFATFTREASPTHTATRTASPTAT
ncbi:MAG: hypothetical protein MUC99_04065, partial [Anaerolineae bacterium]|nr:hypothetical protein [Anaerolineae bacterium]